MPITQISDASRTLRSVTKILHVSNLYKCFVYAEDMLVAIASATGEKVGIDHNRLKTIVAAGFDARHFTLDLSSTRIRSASVPSLF